MIKQTLLRGLKIALPILITLLIVYWVIYTVESIFKAILLPLIPDRFYFPGLGAIVGLTVIYFVGMTFNAWMVNRLYKGVDILMNKIPGVKTIYQATQDFMGMLDSDRKSMGYPVLLELHEIKMIGLVTRRTFEDLNSDLFNDDDIAVYLPMSYQMGGYTIIVRSSLVKPLNIDVQDAMKFVLTAGIAKRESLK